MAAWWRDVIKEATFQGHHTPVCADRHALRDGALHRIGGDVSSSPSSGRSSPRRSIRSAVCGHPRGIVPFDAFHLPPSQHADLAAVRHHRHLVAPCVDRGATARRCSGCSGVTILLGISFTCCQAFRVRPCAVPFLGQHLRRHLLHGDRLPRLPRDRGDDLPDRLLVLAPIRATSSRTIISAFEAAAWYWHFVDVVWLFLFCCVYVWGRLGAPSPNNPMTTTAEGRAALATGAPLPLSTLRPGTALPRSADGAAGLSSLRPRSLQRGCRRRGPAAAFVILILGAVVVALGFVFDQLFSPAALGSKA